MRLARYLCWLLGTSVRKTRRFLRTDVPSSQHSEIVPVHFASYRGHSVPCDQSRSLPHESSAFDGKGKCRLTIGNRVAQSNQKGTHEAQSEVVHASPKVSGTERLYVSSASGNGTTLFTGEQLYLSSTQLWKQNKVVPKTGTFHARIHEINVNLSCSQNCSWDPRTGITGKIKLFPEPCLYRYSHINRWVSLLLVVTLLASPLAVGARWRGTWKVCPVVL